jgi:hypothetical protein
MWKEYKIPVDEINFRALESFEGCRIITNGSKLFQGLRGRKGPWNDEFPSRKS